MTERSPATPSTCQEKTWSLSSALPTCASPRSMHWPDAQLSPPYYMLIQADVTPTSPSGGHGRGPRLYVGGVPDEITEEDIVEHFNKWGQVVDCYFPGES